MQILPPLFQQMHQLDQDINTIEVTDANGTVILRGHNPAEFGDNKAKTLLFGNTLRTRKPHSGVNVSTSTGLLSFDAVSQVFADNQFAGLINVGLPVPRNRPLPPRNFVTWRGAWRIP
jgi:methyl-accepting chemotaxis protein